MIAESVAKALGGQRAGPTLEGAQDAATSLIPIEGSAPC